MSAPVEIPTATAAPFPLPPDCFYSGPQLGLDDQPALHLYTCARTGTTLALSPHENNLAALERTLKVTRMKWELCACEVSHGAALDARFCACGEARTAAARRLREVQA